MLHTLQVLLVQYELASVDKVEEQLQAVAGALVEAELHARRRGHVGLLEQLAETGQDVAVGPVDHPIAKVQHRVAEPSLRPLLVEGGQDVLCMALLCSRHPSYFHCCCRRHRDAALKQEQRIVWFLFGTAFSQK